MTNDLTIAQAEAALAAAQTRAAAVRAECAAAHAVVERLRQAAQAERLTGRFPAEVWTDTDLLAYVTERSWNSGRGDQAATEFLRTAVTDLAPGDLTDASREVTQDYRVLRVVPVLRTERDRDLTPVRAALLTMLPALILDGAMRVDIRDRSSHYDGIPTLFVASPDQARVEFTRYGRTETVREGTLDEVLAWIAQEYGFGPESDEDDDDGIWD